MHCYVSEIYSCSLLIEWNFSDKGKVEAPITEMKEAVDSSEEAKNKKRHLNVVSIGHVGEFMCGVLHLSFAHALDERCELPLLGS